MPSNWHPREEIQDNQKRGHTGHERVKTMESDTDAHPPSELSVQSETDVHPPSIKGTKDDFRNMSQPPPKIFKLLIEPKIWKQISPLKGINKLRWPWTHYMYQKFRKITPCCPLRFMYQHVRATGSRKRQCPYIIVRAKCIFPSCGANYKFTITRKPLKHQYVPVTVCRSGEILQIISSEHSVPPITFWLMQFLPKLSTYTTVQIHRVEMDYSWSLMQAVLLSFNKESVLAFLESVYAICQKQKKMVRDQIKDYLHLCAAHVIKAVSAAFRRKTSDKGLKAFATFVFARLQNTVCVDEALEIFKALCVALLSRYITASVLSSVAFLRDIINQDVPMQETTEETPNWEDEENTSRTITGVEESHTF